TESFTVEMGEKIQSGQAIELRCPSGPVTLEAGDIFVQLKAPDGWAGVADRGTQLAIDVRVTEALSQEGMAREVIRQVQNARKEADLEMEDRIVLYLHTDSAKLRAAIEAHRDYIANETLTTQWSYVLLDDAAYRVEVKIEGQALTIQLRKV